MGIKGERETVRSGLAKQNRATGRIDTVKIIRNSGSIAGDAANGGSIIVIG